jgi:hypothetical protein
MTASKDQATAADFLKLIATPDVPALGPEVRLGVEPLAALNRRLDDFFDQVAPASAPQDALRCAALLWHDHLAAAHGLAQDIANADGGFLHGIMHRREPDYSNAAYWFRRAGRHACYPVLAMKASNALAATGETKLAAALIHQGEWDPFAFIAACKAATTTGNADSQTTVLRDLQRLEFEALVEHLFGAR